MTRALRVPRHIVASSVEPLILSHRGFLERAAWCGSPRWQTARMSSNRLVCEAPIRDRPQSARRARLNLPGAGAIGRCFRRAACRRHKWRELGRCGGAKSVVGKPNPDRRQSQWRVVPARFAFPDFGRSTTSSESLLLAVCAEPQLSALQRDRSLCPQNGSFRAFGTTARQLCSSQCPGRPVKVSEQAVRRHCIAPASP